MTNDEKKAIERLEKRIKDNEDYKTTQVWLTDDVVAASTVLNFITKLQKENKHWKNAFERELEENRKNTCELLKQDLVIRGKNKQIDLMGEVFFEKFKAQLVIEYGIENKEQLIKLFEEKVKAKVK